MLRWAHDELLQTYDSYAARIVNADANLGMLRAALAWVEARSHGGACPPTLSEEWRSLPTSDERIEVVLFDGDNYEMQAPPLRAHPSFERTVFNLVCPAARAAWFDADGNRAPDAEAPHADTTDAEAEADERNEGGARAPD